MFQVRIHGRAGQGAVSGAGILSVAAFLEGRHAQAFPSFGAERMGAPVVAHCRLDDRAIRLREPVIEPDALIVQDDTLLGEADVLAGLRPDGYLVLDTTMRVEELELAEPRGSLQRSRLCALPAAGIAQRHVGRAVPNVPLLAGFAAISGRVRLESLVAAIRRRFPGEVAEKNVAAATEAFAIARRLREAADA